MNDEHVSETPAGAQPLKQDRPGLDAFAEDIFGLSLRGLKTMRDMFVRPAAVFEAARTRDWRNLYTPSIRLVTSLIAVMLLLRVFWAAESSATYQAVLSVLREAAEGDPTIGDPEEVAGYYFAGWALFFPIVYFGTHLIFASLLRIWGKSASFVVRLRLYFAAIIPGFLAALVSIAAFPLFSVEELFFFSAVLLLVAMGLYAAAVYFGLRPTYPKAGARFWRAGAFSVSATIADLIVSVAAGLAASLFMTVIIRDISVPGLS